MAQHGLIRRETNFPRHPTPRLIPQTYPDYEDVEVLIRTEQYKHYEEQLERSKDEDRKSVIEEPEVTSSIVHQTMDMNWALGLNWRNPVVFLKDYPDAKSVFYSCGNMAILFDFHQNSQKLLRGHNHVISSVTTSEDRMWLVTADKGKDSTLNVWEMKSGIPIKTFFNIQSPYGIYATAMSKDRKFLATVSASFPQIVSIWEWSVGSENDNEVQICSVSVDEKYGMQSSVHFDVQDPHCMISSSTAYMLFYDWTFGLMEYTALKVAKSDVTVESPGKLLKSVFHFDPTKVLSSTSKGNVIMWTTKSSSASDVKIPWRNLWRMLKVILIDHLQITEITTCDSHIITGDEGGYIRFHDENMHLLSWMQAYKEGAIVSISFSAKQLLATEMASNVTDLTIQGKPFVTRDFIFCTSTAVIGHVTRNTTKVKIILRESARTITGMDVHPIRSEICWVSQEGTLRLWDYKDRVIVNEKNFGSALTAVCYHPNGRFLGVGFQGGDVHIVDPRNLSTIWRPRFAFTNHPICLCAFSQNSQHFACSDDTRAVALVNNTKKGWQMLGKMRSHLGHIVNLFFCEDPVTRVSRLFSLGLDKAVVEYDLVGSSRTRIKLLRRDLMEQSALPLASIIYPSDKNEFTVMYANSEFKLKLINMDTRKCKKLVLGPVFGTPIHKMALLPDSNVQKSKHRFAVFSAGPLLGLQMLPPTGNPYTSMAIHAHSSKIEYVGASYDALYVFTLDSVNACIGMWDVHLHILDVYAELGGTGMDPFCTLLDGGRNGKIFRELEDYFYYIHLMKQGEDCVDARAVSRTVPVDEIPFIMRALGYFPSEYEIDLMIDEVKHSKQADSDELVMDVDIEMFLKLYINHRPTFGVPLDELDLAFERLRTQRDESGVPIISKRQFLTLMQSAGEKMLPEELRMLMEVVLGGKSEEAVAESSAIPLEKYLHLSKAKFKPIDSSKDEKQSNMIKEIEERMPEELSANTFLSDLLMVSLPVTENAVEDLDISENKFSDSSVRDAE